MIPNCSLYQFLSVLSGSGGARLTSNVLTRLSTSIFHYNGEGSTVPQHNADHLVSNFIEEACDEKTLLPLMAGGIAYRMGRIGVMGMGSSFVLRPLSLVIGLGSEVTAFEFTNRALLTMGRATGRSPLQGASRDTLHASSLWSWSGPMGWKNSLATDFLSFGILRSAGYLGRESNPILQHFFASSAMVFGHQTGSLLGILPRPEGSFAEQLLHASATDLKLKAGTNLVHSLAPNLAALEKGLDLSLKGLEGNSPSLSLPFRGNEGLALAGKMASARVGEFVNHSEAQASENTLFSTGGSPSTRHSSSCSESRGARRAATPSARRRVTYGRARVPRGSTRGDVPSMR